MGASFVGLLSVACAVTVANIYFPQPLLEPIARSMHVPDQAAGIIVSLAQAGYALGLLILVPLGDSANLRRLARVLLVLTTAGLLTAALSPNLTTLAVATVALSTCTVLPQIIVPMAASLAGPERSGQIIGKLGVGLIIGVTLSRTLSGLLTGLSGDWRSAYLVATVLTGGTALVLPRSLPERASRDGAAVPYRQLLRSLPGLLREHREMRLSAALGTSTYALFAAFWTTLTLLLAASPFHGGPEYPGTLALVALPGTMLAARMGTLCDRSGSAVVNALSLAAVALALVVAGLFGGTSLIALGIDVNVLGFGVAAGAIANQARIFRLGLSIRSRLNTIYMVTSFIGASAGSLAGAMIYGFAGWQAMILLCAGFLLIAVVALIWDALLTVRRPLPRTPSRRSRAAVH
jgi:predicted MFS family arabinose efflux permease